MEKVNYRRCIIATDTGCEGLNVFFLVPAHQGYPGSRAIKRVAAVVVVPSMA